MLRVTLLVLLCACAGSREDPAARFTIVTADQLPSLGPVVQVVRDNLTGECFAVFNYPGTGVASLGKVPCQAEARRW